MSPEVLDRVFEPFFTTKKGGAGSGLGLAMVHGFVKQSGGHIRVYSEVGQGTTVRIYLPRHISTTEAAATPIQQVSNFDDVPIAQNAEIILLVEDDDDVRVFAQASLEELGYVVISEANGVDATRVIESGTRFDLLFTDVVLSGGMNGRELAQLASRMRPGVPILFTTGYTRNAIVHNGKLDPDVELLAKPYSQIELAHKLRKMLGRVSPERS
jgi:CheY-like chemotaxis protein